MTDPFTTHFTVKDALYLPSWERFANASDGLNEDVEANLLALFKQLDIVRDYFQLPIIVHCAYRPAAYNQMVGGAPHSSHVLGKAVDFHIQGLDCDSARKRIIDDNKLEEWNMRCEDKPGSSWIHLDTSEPNPSRFFKP